MKPIPLIISLFMTVFITAQNVVDVLKDTLLFSDTSKVYYNEHGRRLYKVPITIGDRDTVVNVTLDSTFLGTDEELVQQINDGVLEKYLVNDNGRIYERIREVVVTNEEPFIEEYFMVFVFLGVLVLFGIYQFLKKKDKKEEVAAEEKYTSKYFGEINKTAPEAFYETKASLYERKVDLIINPVSAQNISQENIWRIEDYIDHLAINETKIAKLIREDFQWNGEVKNFIHRYLQDAGNKAFADQIGANGKVFTKEEQVLSLLYLLRINFYPETTDKVFAVLDYTIDDGLADHLLMVIISKDDRIDITMEH